MRTESIDALACPGFGAIRRAGESCKGRLGLLRREEPEGLDGSMDVDGEWASEETAFGGSYCQQVASRVNMVCGQRLGELVFQVSERIDRFVEEVKEERSRLARVKGRIWKARAALAGRFAVVGVLLSIVMFALAKGAPSQFAYLTRMLSERLFEPVAGGVVSTLLVLALVYVVSGARNENLRQALRLVLLERWMSRSRRGELAAALKAQFDESYDQLAGDLAGMPLRADQAIAEGIVKWLKSDSGSFQKAEQALAELRRWSRRVARCWTNSLMSSISR